MVVVILFVIASCSGDIQKSPVTVKPTLKPTPKPTPVPLVLEPKRKKEISFIWNRRDVAKYPVPYRVKHGYQHVYNNYCEGISNADNWYAVSYFGIGENGNLFSVNFKNTDGKYVSNPIVFAYNRHDGFIIECDFSTVTLVTQSPKITGRIRFRKESHIWRSGSLQRNRCDQWDGIIMEWRQDKCGVIHASLSDGRYYSFLPL